MALKKLAEGGGEMKRLYVRGRHRGTGLGRALAGRVVGEGRRLGYQAVRLDTVPSVMGPGPLLALRAPLPNHARGLR